MHCTRWITLTVATIVGGLSVINKPASAGATLYAISGDGSPTPSTLFTIDTATGAATPVLPLSNPDGPADGGEGIAFNPHDGLLYRTSGWLPSGQTFQTIDPLTLTIGPNLAPGGTYGPDPASEILGIAWYEPLNVFLVTTLNFRLYHVTPTGEFTQVGFTGEWLRGLAVVDGRVYGSGPTSSFHQKIWEIDPLDGTILDEMDLVVDGQLTWATGLTAHPQTGEVYAIVKDPADRGGPRWLAMVDLATGLGTAIGNTGEKFAGITFVVDPVSFESTAQDIADGLAADLIDNSGIAQSLLAKLAAAADAANRGQPDAAIEILAAFALEVDAQTGKHLSPAMADLLLDDAAALDNSL